MPDDGSGNYSRTNGDNTGQTVWQQDKADGDKITASRHDAHDQDVATALNNRLCIDGQNAMSGDLDMGGQDIINLGSGNDTLLTSTSDTYLPEVTTSNADGTIVHVSQVGAWTAIGNSVQCSIDVIATISGSPTGTLQISLPHTTDGTTSGSASIGLYQGITNDKGVYGYITAGSSQLTFQKGDTGNDFTSTVSMTDVAGTLVMRATINYIKV